jgi:hypothetical protein
MPTPHSFASSITASGTRLRAAATHRRANPANKLASWTARSSRPAAAWTTTSVISSGVSRRLTTLAPSSPRSTMTAGWSAS